jgi:hypothetical protein
MYKNYKKYLVIFPGLYAGYEKQMSRIRKKWGGKDESNIIRRFEKTFFLVRLKISS